MTSGKRVNSMSERIELFWSKAKKGGLDDCWEWKAYRNKDGYGLFVVDGIRMLSHRFAWVYYYGDIPQGMKVLHECDNPPCCNPWHLFLGTQLDNTKDMISKGRHPTIRKEILGVEDIILIKSLYSKGGCSLRELACKFDVSAITIWRVVKGSRKHFCT